MFISGQLICMEKVAGLCTLCEHSVESCDRGNTRMPMDSGMECRRLLTPQASHKASESDIHAFSPYIGISC